MKKELFDYLTEGLEDAIDHAKGNTFLPTTVTDSDPLSYPSLNALPRIGYLINPGCSGESGSLQ